MTQRYAVSPLPWRQAVQTSEFTTAALSAARVTESRVSLVDVTHQPVACRGRRGALLTDASITGGSVEMVGETPQMWSAKLSMAGEEWVPTTPEHPLDPRSPFRLAAFWRLLVVPLGGWVEVPVGVYRPGRPQINDDGRVTVTVDCRDVRSVASQGGYGGRVIDVGGLTVDVALSRIAAVACPTVPFFAEPSTVVLPAVYELGARTPTEDMDEIAGMAGQTVRADREGTLRAAVPSESPIPALELHEGPGCQMVDLTREVSDVIYNRVTVTGTNPDLTEPVFGMDEDSDESSPTWVGRMGPYELRIESDVVTTNEAAVSLARMQRGRFARPTETTKVHLRAMPHLDYRARVPMTRRVSGVSGDHLVSRWSLPLPVRGEAPDLMELTMMSRQGLV